MSTKLEFSVRIHATRPHVWRAMLDDPTYRVWTQPFCAGSYYEGSWDEGAHIRFLSPLEPGLKEIFARFKKVMTVEINYSDAPDDPFVTEENRRRGQLSMLLRSATLVDVDCWTLVRGEPLRPGQVLAAMRRRAQTGGGA